MTTGYQTAHYTLTRTQITNFPIRGFASKTSIEGFWDKEGNFIEFKRETTKYDIFVSEDSITVNGKTMPVKYDREFTYKLQKTQIKSSGLPRFFSDNGRIEDGSDLSRCFWHGAYAIICEHVTKNGKIA